MKINKSSLITRFFVIMILGDNMGSNLFGKIGMQTESIVGKIKEEPLMEYMIEKEGIEKYIETPCIKACQRLWELNIATYESSGNEKGGWIAVAYGLLNEENKKIFDDYIERQVEGYSDEISWKNYFGIYVLNASSEEDVSNMLVNLTSVFKMQDVKEGVFDKELFLIRECSCSDYEIDGTGCIIRHFNPSKMEKTFEEYLAEKKAIYIPEEDRVYINSYYLQKHQNYLNYIAQSKAFNKVEKITNPIEATDSPVIK